MTIRLPEMPDNDSDFTPGLARYIITMYRDIIISLSSTEPVVWQYRCMKDWWHESHAEWCDWHNISKTRYDKTLAEIAAGQTRLQVRALGVVS